MQSASQTSRGDLLRWIQRCTTSAEKELSAPILGYEYSKKHRSLQPPPDTRPPKPPPEDPSKEDKKETATLPRELFYTISRRTQHSNPSNDHRDIIPGTLSGVKPLSDNDLQPLSSQSPLSFQPVLPEHRLTSFLRSTLSTEQGRKLDVKRLVSCFSQLRSLHRIPYIPRVLPAGRVYILLDLNDRMLPFWQDAHVLCEIITRKHGRNGLEIRQMDDNPGGQYLNWFDGKQEKHKWSRLYNRSVVFVVSDMGQLTRQDSSIRQQWLRFLHQLNRQSICPVALSPISPQQQCPKIQKCVHQVLWNRHSRLRPEKSTVPHTEQHKYIRRILGILSVAVHVEPELLRAILACFPAQESDSGIEASLFLHKDVVWGYTAIAIQPDKREEYQGLFAEEEGHVQFQILSLLRQHHISQFPAVWAEEVLNAEPLVNFPFEDLDDVQQARNFMRRFSCSFCGTKTNKGMVQYARRHLSRLSQDNRARYNKEYTSVLYGLSYDSQLRRGKVIPEEYDANIVQSVIRHLGKNRQYVLTIQGEYLSLQGVESLQEQEQLQTGSPQGSFESNYDTINVSLLYSHGTPSTRTIQLGNERINIAHLIKHPEIRLDTGKEEITIKGYQKPSWAHSLRQGQDGLEAIMFFAGKQYHFIRQKTESSEDTKNVVWEWQVNDPTSQLAFDQYGLCADLKIKTIVQRFRWIEPGSFLMGSPEDEPERDSDETQHKVTLAKGYWLADTAVTQELWQAVMGENPSHFTDSDQNPVEEVSWEDSMTFIEKLNNLLSGVIAKLPTEAQWEYACRAGTTTPFSLGENITPEQVNYDGNFPYENDHKGLCRDKIIPVKSLPCNNWGLYEMHGNVWEWCSDWFQYPDNPFAKRQNGSKDVFRVFRGGAWSSNGRSIRSAYRGRLRGYEKGSDFGFRLALSHSEHQKDSSQQSQGEGRTPSVLGD